MIYVMSGGASLNYKVVNGTSAPSSPKENTIWVNTSTAITSHVFSATEPTNPAAGMVWFEIGKSAAAPINILKKNTAMVYPNSCKQYVGGAWVAKEAKTYKSNTWVAWRTYLYNNGEDNTDLTGGWEGRGNYGQVTDADGVLYTRLKSGSQGTTGSSSTVKAVDLTNAKTLYFVAEEVTAGGGQVAVSSTTTASTDDFVARTLIETSSEQTIYSVDVSALTGSYYIFMRVTTASTSKGIKVSAIYYE